MINIKLYFRSESKTTTEGYIHVSFYVHREKVHFSTRIKCRRKDWNERTMRISSGDKNAKDKNLILENILSRINDVIVRYRLKNRQLTRSLFLKAYNRPDDYDTFYDFCNDYLQQTGKRIEFNTRRLHESVLKKLSEYAPNLNFDDMNKDFLEDYKTYLKKVKGNNDNTVFKNMGVIRKYVRAAIRAGYMEENPFEEFSVHQCRSNIVYLEESELRQLYEKYCSGDYEPRHKTTLQLFLFMCFGSQHVGDARQMKIEDFRSDSFVYYRIKNRNRKPEPVTVPISKTLKGIIEDICGNRKSGRLFPKLPTDQTMNRYLKEIAKQAGIGKEITHKTGRHTFATYYLANTLDMNSLKDIMGHSDLKQTLVYAHVLEQNKQRGISCFDAFSS